MTSDIRVNILAAEAQGSGLTSGRRATYLGSVGPEDEKANKRRRVLQEASEVDKEADTRVMVMVKAQTVRTGVERAQ